METYQSLVHREVKDYLSTLSAEDHNTLILALRDIEESPRVNSDHIIHDAHGRMVHLRICGNYVVKFWEDTTNHIIRFIDIHKINAPS